MTRGSMKVTVQGVKNLCWICDIDSTFRQLHAKYFKTMFSKCYECPSKKDERVYCGWNGGRGVTE